MQIARILLCLCAVGMSLMLKADDKMATIKALEWKTTKAEIRLKLGADGADAIFAFKNISDKPVKILDMASSCGCTAGKLDKREYGPGEAGEVKAHFSAAGKRGKQVNWLTISTDAGNPPTRLQFTVEIPELMTVKPRLLLWKRGEISPKVAEVRFDGTGKVESLEAVSDSPGMLAVVERTADTALWKLTVAPSASLPEDITRTQIIIKGKTEAAGILEMRVFVQIH